MIEVLLDTNIIIYLLNKEQKYIDYLISLDNKTLGISVISYMEVMIGIRNKNHLDDAESILSNIEIMELSKEIGLSSIQLLRKKKKKNLKYPKLADIIIAQTAINLRVPLLSNNPKDLTRIKNLEIITP